MSLLILGVAQGGQAWAWNSWQSLAAFSLGGLLLVAFVFAERRAAEPILPLWVFSRRLLLTTTLAGVTVGAVLIGLTSYVPTYLEGSIGVAPIVAGLALARPHPRLAAGRHRSPAGCSTCGSGSGTPRSSGSRS